MPTESEALDRTSPEEDDEMLRERVGTCIAEICGGDMPDSVTVHVVDRRVTLSGQVEDIDLSQRIEKAASTPPGILGVSNQLTTRVPPPAEPPGQPVEATGMRADPSQKPAGQVNHKV
ncbi:BON domain-containing protein [Cupriavidus agavae]|uniref:BON domain-containing protein n=1 Tax=Cupriavidus agavae TaxID=1001822 RepID=A0A4Q7S2J4_9BURK|nr:BON domain-containing protein [Cupriavidus agavae]RZT39568.1 BON domain-containing protein [Cupriavidus agavae]